MDEKYKITKKYHVCDTVDAKQNKYENFVFVDLVIEVNTP